MKKRLFIGAAIFIILLALLTLLRLSDLSSIFSLSTIKQQRALIAVWTHQHSIMAVALYILLYVVSGACALPGVSLLTIIGGFLFGPYQATLYTVIGATLGATTLFLVSRYFFGFLIQHYYHQQLIFFHEHLVRYGVFYLLWARLIPIFPFFLINILAALTPIDVGSFIVGTAIGIMPITFLYAYAGQQLMTIQSVGDIFSTNMLIVLSLLSFLALIPLLFKKRTS
jgi:uncharacterized membrane protein YdjX (TVP38/TMEM64 family)